MSYKSLAVYCWGTSVSRLLLLLETRHNIPLHKDFGDYMFDICDFMVTSEVIWKGMQDFTLFSIANALNMPYNYDNPRKLIDTVDYTDSLSAQKIISHVSNVVEITHAIVSRLYEPSTVSDCDFTSACDLPPVSSIPSMFFDC